MTAKILARSILSLVLVIASSFSALAESKLDIRLDGDADVTYNSNIAQVQGFPGDIINSYTGSATARYMLPSQTQILARVQAQYSKFIKTSDFDRIGFTGSLNLSQWLFNSLNVYVAVQPIKSISLTSNKQPLDMLYMTGATYYLPFLENELAYGGYLFDRLQTEAADYRSYDHTVFVGLRHPFSDNFITFLGGRAKFRNVDNNQNDKQFSGNISAQYIITDWLSIQATGEYTQVIASVADKNVGVYNIGINLAGGLNNSFKF